jgi:uncharacterized protein (TIGR02118 family)
VTTVCEIAFAAASAKAARDFLRDLAGICEPGFLDHYSPAAEAARDPYSQDGAAPAPLALLGFPSRAALERAARQPGFAAIVKDPANGVVTCTAMRRIEHPVAGGGSPAPHCAPFSYVVRYHRPAENETLFVRHYLETHPPLLARLPGIRNVLCYVPFPWNAGAAIGGADYMLGNEVVFDDIEAFNAAMASPLRHELRAHFRNFPPFSGRNTHYPMERRRIVDGKLRHQAP